MLFDLLLVYGVLMGRIVEPRLPFMAAVYLLLNGGESRSSYPGLVNLRIALICVPFLEICADFLTYYKSSVG